MSTPSEDLDKEAHGTASEAKRNNVLGVFGDMVSDDLETAAKTFGWLKSAFATKASGPTSETADATVPSTEQPEQPDGSAISTEQPEETDLKSKLSFEAFAEAREQSSSDQNTLSPAACTDVPEHSLDQRETANSNSSQTLSAVQVEHADEDDTIRALRDHCEELEKSRNEAAVRFRSELEQYQEYATELVDAGAQAAKAKRTDLETRIQELREELRAARGDGSYLQKCVATYAEELKAAKAEAGELRSSMATYADEMNTSKAAHESLETQQLETTALANSELRSLRAEVDQLRAETETDLETKATVQEERLKSEEQYAAIQSSLRISEATLKAELEATEKRATDAAASETAIADSFRISEASIRELTHELAEAKSQEDAATNAVLRADQLRMTELGALENDFEARLRAMETRMKDAEEACAAEAKAAQRFKTMKEDAAKLARAAVERAEHAEKSGTVPTALELAAPEHAAGAFVPSSQNRETGLSAEPTAQNEQHVVPVDATAQSPEALAPTCLGKTSGAVDQEPSTEDVEIYGRLISSASAKPPAKKLAKGPSVSGTALNLGSSAAAADPDQRIAQLEAHNKELRKLLADSDDEDTSQHDGDMETAVPNNLTPYSVDALHRRAKKLERAAVAECRQKQGLRLVDKGSRMFTRQLLKNPVLRWIFYCQLLIVWLVLVLRH